MRESVQYRGKIAQGCHTYRYNEVNPTQERWDKMKFTTTRLININMILVTLFLLSPTLITYSQSSDSVILYEGETYDIAWNPAGTLIGVRVSDGIMIYDTDMELLVFLESLWFYQEREVYRDSLNSDLELSQNGTAFAWSPDGNQLVAPYVYLSPFRLSTVLWDTSNNNYYESYIPLVENFSIQDTLTAVEWSPDGQRFATINGYQVYGGDPGELIWLVQIWIADEIPTEDGRSSLQFSDSEDTLTSIAWGLTNDVIAVASEDRKLYLWDVDESVKYEDLFTLDEDILNNYRTELGGYEGIINTLSWNPSQTSVLAGANTLGAIYIWNVDSQQIIHTLIQGSAAINAIDWNSDGTLLASAGDDVVIRIWDVETDEVVATFEGHEDTIIDLDWSPDDQLIATASLDDTVRLWDVAELMTTP